MANDDIILRVERYDPERGPRPYAQSYRVPVRKGMMVLDALNYVRDELDSSLAFRWSCRMGICGSCGMMVNGMPKLTCQDPVDRYRVRAIRIAALDHFPVIRDLVSDISDFMEKLPNIQPWITRTEEKPLSAGEYLQTPEERALYANHAACINCMLCYAACPVYGLDERFLGPAAIALAHRYNLDSRDQGEALRAPYLSLSHSVWECTFVGECSEVCPKHVMPAESIQREKLRLALRWLLPRAAFRRRP
ncbi:MAG: succinate dehydrogenase iron-sulfur subunit [Chloroflexi bacterium]|nr:succinate dehydrogenase iron-sulfur subunit [Chloroflexota bacterium]